MLFLQNNLFFGYILPCFLLAVAFYDTDFLQNIIKFPKSQKKGIEWFLAAFFYISVFCIPAKASLPDSDLLLKYKNPNVAQELESVFEKYDISRYEQIENLSSPSCKMKSRFVYILTQINKIEETNDNIKERFKNLHKRSDKLEENIDKINKREINAKQDKFVIAIPSIETKTVSLKSPYERMMLWGDEIAKATNKPDCNPKCAFGRIDSASLNIVNEITDIHKQQDSVNKYLSQKEKQFDIAENSQRQEELKLTKSGF